MNALRCLAVTGLFLSSFALGCFQPADTDAPEEPGVTPQEGGNTSGGDNGASDAEFWIAQTGLIAAMGRPLVIPGGGWTLNATTDAALQDPNVLPPKLFRYAVRCGLQSGVIVSDGGTLAFTGDGYLSTTSGWLTGALSDDAADDLLACVVAFLNPSGTVPIALTGPSIAEDGVDQSDYDVEEALWQVELDPTGGRIYTAYPMHTFAAVCSIDPFEALRKRVCSHDLQQCQLQHGDLNTCHFKEGEGYRCGENDKPAILTLLKSGDVQDMHPWCIPSGV